jgi:NADPH-dependent 2,4-dienoyl-CoA reductase/sulfur reductase-like enzyme/rhodanese-related sulfurtransferase
MRTVIIGGVAGGMSAATRLRRLDERMEIVVLERGPYVSFANCGLPYHVGGVIADRDALLLQTPESLRARFAIDVRVHTEATSIDTGARSIEITDALTGATSTLEYDELILSPGTRLRFSIDTGDVAAFPLRTIDEMDAIIAALEQVEATHERPSVVVVGAGFIGLEAVENLHARGAAVTIVQASPQVLGPLDIEMTAPLIAALRAAGIDVRLSTTVLGGEHGELILSDGTRVAADLAIIAPGVEPQTTLAAEAGLTLGDGGGIVVDASHRTSAPHVWAIGDAALKTDAINGDEVVITMAGLANRHGREVADAIAGDRVETAPALGTGIVGVLGVTVAMTGWSERRARAAGRRIRVVHTHPTQHAGYYPGALQLTMKLVIDAEDDTILGAQIVGRDGVDKRIDVIATAMAGGITASALARLELAYAPQYASAKDPINMLGYVADNVRDARTRTIQWHELDAARAAGATLVDVRSAGEHAAGSIPGSVNLPLDALRARHHELGDAPLVVHCQVGQRGHTASRLLEQLGHEVVNLDGGYLTWHAGTTATTATLRPEGALR